MTVERRDGRIVLIHEIRVPDVEAARHYYERLFRIPALGLPTGEVELLISQPLCVRVSSPLHARRISRQVHPVSCSETPVALGTRLAELGGEVLAGFSLSRGWTFESALGCDDCRVIARDMYSVTWEFLGGMNPKLPNLNSTLPVSDVQAATEWYPRFFSALGFGETPQVLSYGACVEVGVERWAARLCPAVAWPFKDGGIPSPDSFRASTGETTLPSLEALEKRRALLRKMGLAQRETCGGGLVCVDDAFGHEWYLSVAE